MSYLLDTHALLWALSEPQRLGAAARTVISDRSVRLVVSAATAWELATKARLGKLPAADLLLAGFRRHLERLGAQDLPVTHEHALLAGSLAWDHRDPFDRMIAAQAMLEAATVLTRDPALAALPGLRVLW